MVKSKQLYKPENQGSSTQTINSCIVDSGIRTGKNIWRIYIEGEFIASNTFAVDINGSSISEVFTTDNDTTLGNIQTAILALDFVDRCDIIINANKIVLKDKYIFALEIEGVDATQLVLGTPTVTGGASQVKVFEEEFVYLNVLPGLVVLNQDVVEPLRTSTATGTTYEGFALPGSDTASPVWKIKRTVVTGGDTVVTYADGDTQFDNIWDDRATLTYL